MAWIAEDRRAAVLETGEKFLSEAMKLDLAKKYFARYPTKRACLLPVLHAVQHHYNWIPSGAMVEIAAFLGLTPAEVMDTATFYEEYWLKPKGKYLIQVCRSLACEICGSKELTARMEKKLGVELGETSADQRYTLVELECLGSCGTAPVAMVNEVLHENVTPEGLERIVEGLPEEPGGYRDPGVDWEEGD
jgi:NADH-quinone oxidoreductase subunit E